MLKQKGYYLFMANVLSTEKRTAVIAALAEGCSIRSTVRMTGVAKNTVVKLLADIGEVCSRFQDRAMVGLPCERIQADEIWCFVAMKEKTAVAKGRENEFGCGHTWLFTALCPDTKLVPSWLVGERDEFNATQFLGDLAGRLTRRIQLSTDGHSMYPPAVETVFGSNVDYCQVIKEFGNDPEGDHRYSPAKVTSIEKKVITGNPDLFFATTSHNERNNLSIRTSMRRYTRLTNAFSKKVENLAHAVALNMFCYNFIKTHGTLTYVRGGRPTTPAMAAGIASAPWTYERLVGLLDPRSI